MSSGSWLVPRIETIPAELRTLPWLLWRAEPRADAKPAKVPYRVAEPFVRASSTDPATWSTFEDACEAFWALVDLPADPVRGPIAGIGMVLTRPARRTCIDLDRVIGERGQLNTHAETIVKHADSWTEQSPSGTGLHIFVRGSIPSAVKDAQIEIYSNARYIAVTGHQWPGTSETVRDAQPYLDGLYALARGNACPRQAYSGPRTPPPDDLAGALLARLHDWDVPVAEVKRWSDGFLVELPACPWADEHTSGRGGAAVMIHASGAYDFTCLHAHCARRTWRDFRSAMEQRA